MALLFSINFQAAPFSIQLFSKYLEFEATTAMLALTKPGNKVVLTYTCNRVASTT